MKSINSLSRLELERIWGKTKLLGGKVLEVEVGTFYCFQCHGNVKVKLIEHFPADEPLQPERQWCGTCGNLIGTYYHIPKELRK